MKRHTAHDPSPLGRTNRRTDISAIPPRNSNPCLGAELIDDHSTGSEQSPSTESTTVSSERSICQNLPAQISLSHNSIEHDPERTNGRIRRLRAKSVFING